MDAAALQDNVVTRAAAVEFGSDLAEIVAGRADIMALTQATHDAILRPRSVGGISYAERAAFACRIARLNDDEILARHYEQLLAEQAGADEIAKQLVDPSFDGADDRRLAALLRHIDLVTQSPKNASVADINSLKDAGVTEADIVRLSEIIAFVNYQVRVVAGLRLLEGLA